MERGRIYRQHLSLGLHCGVLLLALIFVLSSCQEKVEWELEMENELRLVVDAKLTNEKKAHEVKLTLPVYEINGVPQAVSGAEVAFFDGSDTILLSEDPLREGVYLTAPDVQGVVNKNYILLIKVNDYLFWAATRMVGISPIRTPAYYKVSNDPELYDVNFGGSDSPSLIKLELDWSAVEGYEDLPDEDTHAVIFGYYFSVLTVDANELFASNHDRVRVPPGTHVIITKKSLSEGYQEYLRGMLSETTWNGGLFDVKPGDPFTNLSAGAIGYFSASSVLRDTIIFIP
jgi:hypothetical protein